MKNFFIFSASLLLCQSVKLKDYVYRGTSVFELYEGQAIRAITDQNYEDIKTSFQDKDQQWVSLHPVTNAPRFVVCYKDQCPQCENMKADWIKLAEKAQVDKLKIDVMAVSRDDNTSATHRYKIA